MADDPTPPPPSFEEKVAAMTTERELELASNELEARRLSAHMVFQAQGQVIARRRDQIATAGQVAAWTDEKRQAVAEALLAVYPSAAPEAEG